MNELLFKRFYNELKTAQRDRQHMPLVDNDSPWWNTYERILMWKSVNALRFAEGRKPLPYSDIVEADDNAAGHSDYTKKFALYCAELVDKE